MNTIPSRLAQVSQTSVNALKQRQRALSLYRSWYRSAPEIIALYALNSTPTEIRRSVREQFELNRYVADPKVIDILLHKGRIDYQETMNCWRQEPHIYGIMLAPKQVPQRNFLQMFYEGRDEKQVRPAVSEY